MVAAIVARRSGDNVTIIEKNNNLGKKLLLTGNGRCNYYNDDMSLSNFYSSGDKSKIINETNLNKLKNFFDSIGLIPRVKNGYYYPYSNTSTAIHNSFLKEINILGINIINDEVIDISKKDKFIIKTNNNIYECDKLILSTGGITIPKTGSNGFGYDILKKLGHNIIKPEAALVPLVTDESVKDWASIRTDVRLTINVDGKLITEEGEAQLTNYGISGICTMNISRFIKKGVNNTLYINFLPNIDNLYNFIEERNKLLKERTIIELLEMVLNYKLLYFILKKSHINSNSKWNDLNNKEKNVLINNISNYKLNIVDTMGIMYGETTSGGVPLEEVTSSCESTIIKNLYITGELLDIDAKCGGYNLTNAFITGLKAGEK